MGGVKDVAASVLFDLRVGRTESGFIHSGMQSTTCYTPTGDNVWKESMEEELNGRWLSYTHDCKRNIIDSQRLKDPRQQQQWVVQA